MLLPSDCRAAFTRQAEELGNAGGGKGYKVRLGRFRVEEKTLVARRKEGRQKARSTPPGVVQPVDDRP